MERANFFVQMLQPLQIIFLQNIVDENSRFVFFVARKCLFINNFYSFSWNDKLLSIHKIKFFTEKDTNFQPLFLPWILPLNVCNSIWQWHSNCMLVSLSSSKIKTFQKSPFQLLQETHASSSGNEFQVNNFFQWNGKLLLAFWVSCIH